MTDNTEQGERPFYDVPEGHWTDSALRVLPRGPGLWSGLPAKAYSYFIGRRYIATTRFYRAHGAWSARIDGFEWLITPDMPAARFQKVPGGKEMTHTTVKGFATSNEAKKAIETVIAGMP